MDDLRETIETLLQVKIVDPMVKTHFNDFKNRVLRDDEEFKSNLIEALPHLEIEFVSCLGLSEISTETVLLIVNYVLVHKITDENVTRMVKNAVDKLCKHLPAFKETAPSLFTQTINIIELLPDDVMLEIGINHYTTLHKLIVNCLTDAMKYPAVS